jgi:diadenosine tetraphosphate (Ap4A) HIT family hydrolase
MPKHSTADTVQSTLDSLLVIDCHFCRWSDAEYLVATPRVRAHFDAFPVSPGHALIVIRRNSVDWCAATDAERHAVEDAGVEVRR